MTMNARFCTLFTVIAGVLLAVPAAQAADGEITFNGEITSQTCTINGGIANGNFAVALPKVSTSALAAAGSAAGRTPFAIALSNCSPMSGEVAVQFEAGPSVNVETGRLIIDNSTVQNVEISLLNNDYTQIMVGRTFALQNSKFVDITGGNATLEYYAEYFSESGGATSGPVTSRVQYTLVYQ